jgi:hypothetical protein
MRKFGRAPGTRVLAGVLLCAAAAHAPAHDWVMLNMSVTLDQVAQGRPALKNMAVGHVDKLRIVYDADAVDPHSRRVALLNFQHYQHGKYEPAEPDPRAMPMTDAWLDLSEQPYRMHLKAAVVHGTPIIIDVDSDARRLTIHPQDRPDDVLISGPYVIDPTPHRGKHAAAAGTVRSP